MAVLSAGVFDKGSLDFASLVQEADDLIVHDEFDDASPDQKRAQKGSEKRKVERKKTTFQDPTGPPGQLYLGEFEDQMKDGEGYLYFEVAGIGHLEYEGTFFKNKKHGDGVLKWPDGRRYEGQFLDDEFHGEGVMTWPDGNRYVGQYVNGKKDGEGTLSFADGSTFSGQWHEGKRHGEITWVKADGTTKLLHFNMDRVYKPDSEQTISECATTASERSSKESSSSLRPQTSSSHWRRRGEEECQRWRVVDWGGAVVRFSSDLKSKKLGKLHQNDELLVDEVFGRRLHVMSPIVGWVSSSTEGGLIIMEQIDKAATEATSPPREQDGQISAFRKLPAFLKKFRK